MVSSDSISYEAKNVFADRLWLLLNKPTIGKEQYRSRAGGTAYGRARRIGPSNFRKHLLGSQTLAVSCIRCSEALFIVFDIDCRFSERLNAIRGVLSRKQLSEAAFAMNGSSDGRGKVVVTFAKPVPQSQALGIADEIAREARQHPQFGDVDGDFTVFPNQGSAAGNVVRLFGTNLRRGASHL